VLPWLISEVRDFYTKNNVSLAPQLGTILVGIGTVTVGIATVRVSGRQARTAAQSAVTTAQVAPALPASVARDFGASFQAAHPTRWRRIRSAMIRTPILSISCHAAATSPTTLPSILSLSGLDMSYCFSGGFSVQPRN
jgi:hypothetical protein